MDEGLQKFGCLANCDKLQVVTKDLWEGTSVGGHLIFMNQQKKHPCLNIGTLIFSCPKLGFVF